MKRKISKSRGFSLLEMLIVVSILTVVFAIVLQGIMSLQRRNAAESSKQDIVQESREFLDQTARDLHQAGYPAVKMVQWDTTPPTGTTAWDPTIQNDKRVAVGLVKITPYSIQFEADTDGSGVKEETIQLVDSAGTVGGSSCPCRLQRGTTDKRSGTAPTAQNIPVFYAELNYLTTATPFGYYDRTGTKVGPGTGSPAITSWDFANNTQSLASIGTVQISLNVQSPTKDLSDKVAPAVNMTSEIKINNH